MRHMNFFSTCSHTDYSTKSRIGGMLPVLWGREGFIPLLFLPVSHAPRHLTVPRLGPPAALVADVSDLFADHEVDDVVVVVCGGVKMMLLLMMLLGGTVSGLDPRQTERSPPLRRLPVLARGRRRRRAVGGGFGPGPRTRDVASTDRHVGPAGRDRTVAWAGPSTRSGLPAWLLLLTSHSVKKTLRPLLLPVDSFRIKAHWARNSGNNWKSICIYLSIFL